MSLFLSETKIDVPIFAKYHTEASQEERSFKIAVDLGEAVDKQKRIWVCSSDKGLDGAIGYWNSHSTSKVVRVIPNVAQKMLGLDVPLLFQDINVEKAFYRFIQTQTTGYDWESFMSLVKAANKVGVDVFRLFDFYDTYYKLDPLCCVSPHHLCELALKAGKFIASGDELAFRRDVADLLDIYGSAMMTRLVNSTVKNWGELG